jgi:hypothetical protein
MVTSKRDIERNAERQKRENAGIAGTLVMAAVCKQQAYHRFRPAELVRCLPGGTQITTEKPPRPRR